MKKFIIAVGVALSLLVGQASASTTVDILSSTFKLHRDGTPICSGQFVETDSVKDIFLTAAHCVKDKDATYSVVRYHVNDNLDPTYDQVVYLKRSKVLANRDVAVLEVVDPSVVEFDTVDVASEEEAKTLQPGYPVIFVGYPMVKEITVTDGLFTGRVKTPPEAGKTVTHHLFRATVGVTGGSSGGGLYAEFDGEWKLLGTAYGGFTIPDFINYFSTTDAVHDVLPGKAQNKSDKLRPPDIIIQNIIDE